jgi:tripartite-type tricarboxylate transporter receptor subunit TctC
MNKLATLLARAAGLAAAALLVILGMSAPVQAQMKQNWMYASSVPLHEQKPAFPIKDKPIRIVLEFAPGSSADAQARAVAPLLAESLGVAVQVENFPGAGGLRAVQEVLNSMADGHTLLYAASSTMAQTPHLLNAATFDPLNDFAQISVGATSAQTLLVAPSLAANNVSELVAYAKANPGRLSVASEGSGSASHLLAQALALHAGTQLLHRPCGDPQACLGKLRTGRAQLMFADAALAIQAVRAGQAKVLGVAAPQRSPYLPNVPTFSEQGVSGIDVGAFSAWYAPRDVKIEAVAKLNAALADALDQPSVQEVFKAQAQRAQSSSPRELIAMLKEAYDAWGEMIKRVGVAKQ